MPPSPKLLPLSTLSTRFTHASLLTACAATTPSAAPVDAPRANAAGGDMAVIAGGALHVGDGSTPAVPIAPFRLDRSLVTVSAYAKCVHAGACSAPGEEQRGTPGAGPEQNALCNQSRADRSDHPINCVDWTQADAFCRWAGKRLPSEEEWEWAARGPENRIYPWGSAAPADQACWNRLQGEDYAHAPGTCAVGSHPTGDTPAGVHDLAGNVWEWTASAWTVPYGGTRDPSAHAIRGGGWRDADPDQLRGTNRNGSDTTDRVINMGFRCATTGP